MSESERDAVWSKLPERHSRLGIRVRLLSWTPDEIIGFAAETLTQRLGTWSIGRGSIAAVFPRSERDVIEVTAHGNTVIARATNAAFRLRINDKVRAFGFAEDRRVALILPKGRANVSSDVQRPSLADADAIDSDERGTPMLDLGSDDPNVRWSVRSDNADLDHLKHVGTRHKLEAVATHGSKGAAVVWETAIARIEIRGSSLNVQSAPNWHVEPNKPSGQRGNEALPAYAAEVATFHPQIRPDG